MSKPPVMRVFFAVDLPAAIKDKIGNFIAALKKQSKSHAIRWSKPENLHITLQFLAEVHHEHVPHLIENVRAKLKGSIKKSNFKFGVPRLFPNPYRPRVIVLEVTPQENFAALSVLIGEGIKATQYEIEQRTYRAHLTIGRLKSPQHVDLHFLSEISLPETADIPLHEVVLFRSEPQPEGSKYTPLERITLMESSGSLA